MIKIIVPIFFFLLCSLVQAKDLQRFDPDVFGHSSIEPVKLLHDRNNSEVAPIIVQLDIKDGIYYAATVTYPGELSFEEARESLNRVYKRFEKQYVPEANMCNWRVEENRYAISLTKEEDYIIIRYITFQPNEVIFKQILKSQGIDPDKLDCDKKEK